MPSKSKKSLISIQYNLSNETRQQITSQIHRTMEVKDHMIQETLGRETTKTSFFASATACWMKTTEKEEDMCVLQPAGDLFTLLPHMIKCGVNTDIDAEAETPILWPPHAKSWLTGKDSDAGRDWGQ